MRVTELTPPEALVAPEVIAQFLGLDEDQDASQDAVLPGLWLAAVELGEQHTGITWAKREYRVETRLGRGSRKVVFPWCPVFAVRDVAFADEAGQPVAVEWAFSPSVVESRMPYAVLEAAAGWGEAVGLSLTAAVGWTAENFPPGLRTWALMRTATLYDNRDDMAGGATSPRGHALSLLDRYTVRVDPLHSGGW